MPGMPRASGCILRMTGTNKCTRLVTMLCRNPFSLASLAMLLGSLRMLSEFSPKCRLLFHAFHGECHSFRVFVAIGGGG